MVVDQQEELPEILPLLVAPWQQQAVPRPHVDRTEEDVPARCGH